MKGPPISMMTIEDLYDLVHHVTTGYEIELMMVLGAVKDWVDNQPGDIGKGAVLGPVRFAAAESMSLWYHC